MKELPKRLHLSQFGLTEQQQFILGAATYLGNSAWKEKLCDFMKLAGFNHKEFEKDWHTLYQKGMVPTPSFKEWSYDVCPPNHLIICLNIIFLHPKWIPIYRDNSRLYGRGKALWDVAEALAGTSKVSFVQAIKDSTYVFDHISDYLYPLIFYKEFHSLLAKTDSVTLYEMTYMAFDFLTVQESIDNQLHYDVLEAFVRASRPAGEDGVTPSAIDCLRYLAFGTLPDATLPDDEWTLAVKAIQALHRDDCNEALALFSKSLKLHNKHSANKNFYENPVLTLMLVVCYLKCDTPDTRKKVQQILNKPLFAESDMFLPIRLIVLRFFSKEIPDRVLREIGIFLQLADRLPIRASLAKIALLFLKVGPKACQIDESAYGWTPRWAILRFEHGGLKNAPIPESLSVFGTHPQAATITYKERWQAVMEDVEAALSSSKSKGADAESRLIYIIHNNSVEIREQRRLKSGNWGVGRTVSQRGFAACEVECMTDSDRRAATSITDDPYYCPLSPDNIIPFMVGEDRVFREIKGKQIPLTITEEPPFLVVEPKSGKLVISTNVPVDSYSEAMPVSIRYDSDDHAVVCRLSTQQEDILTRLLALGSIPLTAKEPTKKFLESIAKHIEIHSPLLEGGSLLSRRAGSSVILLRMMPQQEDFFVTPVVQPLPGGSLRLAPGSGKKVVFDEAEGERFQVSRDLKAETQHLSLLKEAVGLDFDPEGSVLTPEEMLSLVEYVQEHPDCCAMEWLAGTQYKVRQLGSRHGADVGLASKEGWFEIEGSVELDKGEIFTSAEFLKLLAEGLIGRRYVRLSQGEYVALGEQLAKQLQQLSLLAQYDRKGAHIPRYQVGALAEILDKKSPSLKADRGFSQLKKKIEEAANMKIAVPSQLKAQLRDYQEEGFRWMARLTHWGAGACLADDMGLGKTVQAIALMLHRADQGPTLVLCPASVLYNWKSELQRFAPSLDITILSEAEDRAAAIASATDYGVVLSTYGLLVREAESLRQKEWNIVVLDEAHTIKNRNTKMSAAAMDLQAKARILLTGTPVQNYLAELWNLFQFLNPGLLGTFEHFTNRYILPIERDENKTVQAQLRRAIAPFLLRRTKAEVVEELPEKTEIVHMVSLSDAERTAYEALRISAQETMQEEQKVGVNVLSMITRLREAACSISLVSKEWAGGSSKVEAFKELVEQIVMGGNRVLVFSQFTSFLASVRQALDGMEGMKYLSLDGSTPTRKRAEMVKQFQHGDIPVFLISLKAGGLGLNLTGANYVIHLDPWWNPAIEQQATDRAYRIGQTQNVTVYHLVSDRTIEQKILRLHKTKREMADALLEGANVGHAMTLDDLKFLVDED